MRVPLIVLVSLLGLTITSSSDGLTPREPPPRVEWLGDHFVVSREIVDRLLEEGSSLEAKQPCGKGVPVFVTPNGWLARLGLQEGDRIVRIDTQRIREPRDLLIAYKKFRTRKRLDVEVLRPTRVLLRYRIE